MTDKPMGTWISPATGKPVTLDYERRISRKMTREQFESGQSRTAARGHSVTPERPVRAYTKPAYAAYRERRNYVDRQLANPNGGRGMILVPVAFRLSNGAVAWESRLMVVPGRADRRRLGFYYSWLGGKGKKTAAYFDGREISAIDPETPPIDLRLYLLPTELVSIASLKRRDQLNGTQAIYERGKIDSEGKAA